MADGITLTPKMLGGILTIIATLMGGGTLFGANRLDFGGGRETTTALDQVLGMLLEEQAESKECRVELKELRGRLNEPG